MKFYTLQEQLDIENSRFSMAGVHKFFSMAFYSHWPRRLATDCLAHLQPGKVPWCDQGTFFLGPMLTGFWGLDSLVFWV